jgi:phage shock protein E
MERPMVHLLLLLSLACSTPSAPSSSGPTAAASLPSAVGVAELKAAVDAGAVVIDVRTDDEYNSGHVPGARHLPLNELPGRLDEIESLRDRDVYLICAVGGRSARATKLLAQEGFSRPINVTGGTDAWREAGYPLD